MFYLWDPPKNISPSCQNIFYHFRPPSIFINLFRSPSQYFFHYTKYLFSFLDSPQIFCEDIFHFLDLPFNIFAKIIFTFWTPFKIFCQHIFHFLDPPLQIVGWSRGKHTQYWTKLSALSLMEPTTGSTTRLLPIFESNCKMYLSQIEKLQYRAHNRVLTNIWIKTCGRAECWDSKSVIFVNILDWPQKASENLHTELARGPPKLCQNQKSFWILWNLPHGGCVVGYANLFKKKCFLKTLCCLNLKISYENIFLRTLQMRTTGAIFDRP